MAALEPNIREFCSRSLDPLTGVAEFDLVADFAAEMPMRVIGMLFGIPESEQEDIRATADAGLRTEAGQPMEVSHDTPFSTDMFAEYIDWRLEHPSEDLMTELLTAEFEDETGTTRRLTRDEALLYTTVVAGAGNETTTRLIGWAGKVLAECSDARRELVAGSDPHPQRSRGAPALRVSWPAHCRATSPRKSSTTARRSLLAVRCCSLSLRPTVTSVVSPIPTASTFIET